MRNISVGEWQELQQNKVMILKHDHVQSVSMHGHPYLEISYMFSGSAEHTLDGHTAALHKGDYLIVDYGSRHSYRSACADGFSNWDLLFLPELLDPVLKGTQSLRALLEHYLLHFNLQALVQNPAHMVFHDTDGRIYELLCLMHSELCAEQAGYTEILRCYLIEILLLTIRKLDDAQTAAAGENLGSRIAAYLSEHYMEPLTLGEIAKRWNYSMAYVSKKFKDDMGISFVRYLRHYRVMQGCRLLSNTKKSVAEIAELVGYRDVKFFSALIKQATGLSPSDFRRQCGK